MKTEVVVVLSFLVIPAVAPAQTKPSREQEIRRFVEWYDNALNRKDVAAVERLLAPEYVYFSSKGEVRSRQSLLDELLSPKYILASAERTDVKVYQTSGTAVVSSRWKGQGTYDGQPFHDDQRCSIVLAQNKQQWLVLSEHCTQIVPTEALKNLEGEMKPLGQVFNPRTENFVPKENGGFASSQVRQIALEHICVPGSNTSSEQFHTLMQTIAEGWNHGDAKLAASCFAENAIYSAPPSSGHHGRKALYEFFGGAKGREFPMHMIWHNLVFDPVQQIGAGEYTFKYRAQTHGLVIVKLTNGLILNWREYEVESNMPWDQFVEENRF
jgi:ketosteroid isomerase-like protein